MSLQLTEQERVLNVRTQLLDVITSFGGQRIIAGEPMENMVSQLIEQVDELARNGFLPLPNRWPLGTEPEKSVDPGNDEILIRMPTAAWRQIVSDIENQAAGPTEDIEVLQEVCVVAGRY